ncbi:MAG: hypothetical protein A3H92_09305 [Rhodospirillales bacterium RIFCSPLOWO2_02_FULL_58_16]|nr:MAG: hypothetical protein A3H92_09305 [Rhodospirillales bacterium RIFCSPLOWO2_02_FULL_58_16]
MIEADPGSFRDVAGTVFHVDGRILRTVGKAAAEDFDFLHDCGLLDELVAAGRMVDAWKVDADIRQDAHYVLEHPRLPFISYPYEWCFTALKSAALLHLDVHLSALDKGMTLSDASAYNVQFIGSRPIFIDALSFRRYRQGEFWLGYRQFCRQFLNPLLLRSLFAIPHNDWFRGSLEGIPTEELRRMLSPRHFFSGNILTHVVLQAALGPSDGGGLEISRQDIGNRTFPLSALRRMLRKLRTWISGLKPGDRSGTQWREYETFKSYSDAETGAKKAFVAEFCEAVRPAMLWDMGCNTGEFSKAALDSGAGRAVGWDMDQNALDIAFTAADQSGIAFTPLFGNAANPSPAQGWNQAERMGWFERGPAEAVLALAFVHHLAITHNAPLNGIIGLLISIAPTGVIEFAPKSDPQIQRMLQLRDDIFNDYAMENFSEALSRRARIIKSGTLEPSGRKLIWFDAREASS